MARKVVNRKALREEAEAAEKAAVKKKVAKKKKAAKRASRSKEPIDVRKKVFWGVFNQSLKRVATFNFDEKKAAQAKADALSQSGKALHFVQKVKEIIEEE